MSRILKICKISFKQLQEPYYQGFAAQISFYFIMSLVPTILLLSQLAYILFQDKWESAMKWAIGIFENTTFGGEISKLLVGGSGGGAISFFFFILALWSASKVQFALIRLSNYTMTGGETTGKGFLVDRIRSIYISVLFMLMFIFAIILLIYGDELIAFLFKLIGKEALWGRIWLAIGWPVSFFIYIVTVSNVYYMLFSFKIKYRDILPGSIFASVGIIVVTFVYSKYIKVFANYNILYGSMATIITMLLWFFFIAWVLCLGMLFNKAWMETK